MGPRSRRAVALLAAAGLVGWPHLVDGAVPGSCHGVAVTIAGTDGDDRIVGTPGRDVVAAGPGDDVVHGHGGDDLVCGGAGSDRLVGGDGDDELDGGADKREVVDTEAYDWIGDALAGGPGDDVLGAGPVSPEGPRDTVTWAASATGVEVDLAAGTATGEGTDSLVGPWHVAEGSRHDDVLAGSGGAEELVGLAGADRLEGRGGDDMLVGFHQRGGEGSERDGDVLLGGDGRDYLDGDVGPDLLRGGDGPDALRPDRGVDLSYGGRGADDLDDVWERGAGQLLDGGVGTDVLSIGLFSRPGLPDGEVVKGVRGRTDLRSERLRATYPDGHEVVVAVRGFEVAWTPLLHQGWTLLGTDAADRLLAGERPGVTLRGRGGDDDFSGSFRRDVVDGGPGRDSVIRSPGGDVLRSVERVRR